MNKPLNPLYTKWQQIIDDWKQTGLTQARYYKLKQLTLSQFKYFRTRLTTFLLCMGICMMLITDLQINKTFSRQFSKT